MIKYPMFITTSDPVLKGYQQKNFMEKYKQALEDRYLYFVKTINSLEKSGVDLSLLHIYDDFSEYTPKLHELLYRQKRYNITHRPENLGPCLNTVHGLFEMLEKYPDKEYYIFIQDDVIFAPGWLDRGIEIFRQIDSDIANNAGHYAEQGNYREIRKIGFLCLYNRIGRSDHLYYLLPTGHPGGVCWIIKKDFIVDYFNTFDKNDMGVNLSPKNERCWHNNRNIVDYKLGHRAHSLGWDCAKVGKSLVQHIGDQSALTNRDMSEHRSKNFVGRE